MMSFYQELPIKNNKLLKAKRAILQTYQMIKHHIKKQKSKKADKRMSSCVFSQKGSLTVEASIAIPFFLFAVVNLLSALDILRLQSNLEMAMHQTAKEMAIYSYAFQELGGNVKEQIPEFTVQVVDHIYAKEKVSLLADKIYLNYSPLVGGIKGLSFQKSNMKDNDMIDLVAEYQVKPAISMIGFIKMPLMNRCRVRAWTGYDNALSSESEDESDEYVYVTETGTVYHTNRNCSHLTLSIQIVPRDNIETLRNENGEKYKPCEVCKPQNELGEVLIAKQGNRYHKDLSCSGLKRTVYTILLSEVGGRTLCARCKENNDCESGE